MYSRYFRYINETGWPYKDVFINKYGKVIDAVKEINPGAQIYVQQILPVSKEVSGTHSYIKNEKIAEYNELLQEMAEEKQVYFVAAAEAVAGEDGTLPDDAATAISKMKKSQSITSSFRRWQRRSRCILLRRQRRLPERTGHCRMTLQQTGYI